MKKNAIILAAGKSYRFAPFTYERPKGLFRVKGEILIERQIRQLVDAGIDDIYIVVGYMKEKFFYLENKFKQVHLLINNKFGTKGNLYSLYVAKDYLENTFISYSDYYFESNPFVCENPNNVSYYTCVYKKGKFKGFGIKSSDANIITEVDLSGKDQLAMVCPGYLNINFTRRLIMLLEAEINDFRICSLFWEEYFARHIKNLTLNVKLFPSNQIIEFDNIEDLYKFDVDFLYNLDSDIINNISQTIRCKPRDIKDINVINAGLTNVSFKFKVKSNEYVYRHPGGTAGNLIDRKTEYTAEKLAKQLGIDDSYINMDLEGWKLSHCIQNIIECDFRKHPSQMKHGIDFLRRMHQYKLSDNDEMKVFDNYEEGIKLMKIASATKGNLFEDFKDEIQKVKRLDGLLKQDAHRLGIKRVWCHNDIYEPNFIVTFNDEIYLIDWEYAGLNDPANDLACFFSRYDYTDNEIDLFIKEYFQGNPTNDEYRHWYAFIPLCAFYWICWGLYKGSVGDDDGFFFLPAYRNFHKYIDKAIALFEN